jgi:hypothetical protein
VALKVAQYFLKRLGNYHCGGRNCVESFSDNIDDVRDFLDARTSGRRDPPKLIALEFLGNKAAIFNIWGSFVEASLQQQATQQS